MRIARLIVISAIALAASGAAEAGWFGSKQPKAISVLDRGRAWNANRMSHATRDNRYNRPGWGSLSAQVYGPHPNRMQPYIRGY